MIGNGQGPRWMHLVMLLGVAGLLVPLAPAQADDGGILVWRLEKKSGVSDADIDSLSGFITAQVELYSERKVTSEADINTILKGEQARQQCGQESSSCIAEVGNALGVPEAVSGDLGHVADYWFLNLRRLNVRRAEVLKRSSRSVKGDLNALIATIPGAVAELFGKHAPEPEPPPAVAAAPAPATAAAPAAPAATAAAKKPEPAVSLPMNPYKKAGYATFFTGLGLAALGGVATLMSSDKADDYHKASTVEAARDARDASRAWMGGAWAGYALGGALMITGVALWAVSPGDQQWWKDHSISAGPTAAGQGAAVMFQGRW